MENNTNSAAVSMIGNIFSELLADLPDPFVFSGYEDGSDPSLYQSQLVLQNQTYRLMINIRESGKDLTIQDATIRPLFGDKELLKVENSNQLGIKEFIQDALLPKMTSL